MSGRYTAHFLPQAWQCDYAIEVDAEGPTTFDITEEMKGLSKEQIDLHVRDSGENDDFRNSPNAPQWIKDWSGPFEITVVVE